MAVHVTGMYSTGNMCGTCIMLIQSAGICEYLDQRGFYMISKALGSSLLCESARIS